MSIWSAEQALKNARRNRESAGNRHAATVKKQSTLETDVARVKERIAKASSAGQRRSQESQLRMKEGQLARARNDVSNRLSDNIKADAKVSLAETKLREEEERERVRQQRVAEQKRKQDEQKQRRLERAEQTQRQREERVRREADERRDQREAAQEREITGLTHRTTELEEKLAEASRKAAPAEVAVLFLASSPEDQVPLRLDKEAREIEKRVRASDFRDAIYFRSKTARQLTDLLDDLNEVKPTILHFSGHGSDAELAFEDGDGNTTPLDNATLSKLLGAGASTVRLVVFNSCDSAAQAELTTEHVEIAIGMDTAIDDTDAKVFAGQFYSSLGYGLSVADAFEQAKVQLALDGSGTGAEVPQIFAAEDVDPEVVVLVNPDASNGG